MLKIFKLAAFCISIISLVACGGSTKPKEKIYNISLSKNKMAFQNELFHQSEGLIDTVIVEYDGDDLAIGYDNESDIVGWLEFEHKKIKDGQSEIVFKVVNENQIAEGDYSASVIVSTGSLSDYNLSKKKVDVSLKIWKENYDISSSVSALEFKNEFLNEAEEKSKTFDVSYSGQDFEMGFSPDGTPAGWIDFDYEIIEDGKARVTVTVQQEDQIIDNFYTTKLRMITGDFEHYNREFIDVEVNLSVWRFETNKENVEFDFIFGNNNNASFELNVMGNTSSWEITEIPSWLETEILEGKGETNLIFNVDPSAFIEVGKTESNLVIKDNFSEKEIDLPISVGVRKASFSTDKETVLLSIIGEEKNINSLLSVTHNSNIEGSWSVTTESNWIKAEKTSEKTLQIDYMEDLSLSEGIHEGKVTLVLENEIQSLSKVINVKLIVRNESLDGVQFNGGPNSLASVVAPEQDSVIYLAIGKEIIGVDLISSEIVFQHEVVGIEGTMSQLLAHPKKNILFITTSVSSNEDNYSKYYEFDLNENQLKEILFKDANYKPKAYLSINDTVFFLTEALEILDEDLNLLHWNPENAFSLDKYKVVPSDNGYFVFNYSKNEMQLRTFSFNPFLNEKIKENIEVVHKFEQLNNYEVKGFDLSRDHSVMAIANLNHETFSKSNNNFESNGKLHQEGYSQPHSVYWHNEQLHVLRYRNDYTYTVSLYNKDFELISERELESSSIAKAFRIEGLEKQLYINSNNNLIIIE